MAIYFACPHCATKFAAKEEHAGVQGKCPECGKMTKIPSQPTREPDDSPHKSDSARFSPPRKGGGMLRWVGLIGIIIVGTAGLLAILSRPMPLRGSGTQKPGSSPGPSSPEKPGDSTDTAIQLLFKSYLEADLGERYKYVHEGSRLKHQMAVFYTEALPPVRPKVELVTLDDIEQAKDGASIVTATIKQGGSGRRVKCYMKKAGSQWLVDWPATVGLNPITLKAFKATAPKQRTTLRVTAELSNYFNYQYLYANPTHFSIKLEDYRGDWIHGYVQKGSKDGKELYELLQDGIHHQITVAVQCTGTEGSVVEIVDLVSRNWFID